LPDLMTTASAEGLGTLVPCQPISSFWLCCFIYIYISLIVCWVTLPFVMIQKSPYLISGCFLNSHFYTNYCVYLSASFRRICNVL